MQQESQTIYAFNVTLTHKGEKESLDSFVIDKIDFPEEFDDQTELTVRNQCYKDRFMSPVGKLNVWIGYSSISPEKIHYEKGSVFTLYNIPLKDYYELGKKKELTIPDDIDFKNSN